jgi:FixJ family two-component response regulator
MRGGAIDFLEKRAPKEQLIAAVVRALDRNTTVRIEQARNDELKGRFAGLTPREREVLEHIVRGSRNRQIAADLAIHERTVNLHRAAIARRSGYGPWRN